MAEQKIRYLTSTTSGVVFPYSEKLAARADMTECGPEGKPIVKAKNVAQPIEAEEKTAKAESKKKA